MIMNNIMNFNHNEALKYIKNHTNIIDATAGNGHDSLFLLKNSNYNNLYCFDIQKEALNSTQNRCNEFNNIYYILDSHSNISTYNFSNINLAIFNLGYLPGIENNITTTHDTTIPAIKSILDILNVNGAIIITIYTKHDDHKEEKKLLEFISSLDKYTYAICRYELLNLNEAPYTIIIERKK